MQCLFPTRASERRPRGWVALWLTAILAALGAGAWWYLSQRGAEEAKSSDLSLLHTISRGDFELTVTERGEIESAGSTEVRSEVKSMNTTGVAILKIVPEGIEVKKGDFLVELDSSQLRSDRLLQQIAVNTAEAAEIEAKNLYETTLIARQEYLEGVYVQERQTIESEVFVAQENVRRAQDYLEYSRKLAAKGYVNELQLEADEFALEKASKELDAARTKLRVLDEFTKAKTLKTLDSDIAIAKAKYDSFQKSHQLELDKLAEIEDQISKCILTAPDSGTVVFAHGAEGRDGQEFVVEEGALIRERQAIIRLPDPSKMQVAVAVNESLIQYVRPGMPAAIRMVGSNDRVLRGSVNRVNQYAEPTNWRRANVKDYKAIVNIDEPSDLVKTGMTASVTINSVFVPDAVQAPVQSVYAHGDDQFCFVERQGKLTAQPVVCGPTNDRFFVIESGLDVGDKIAMNPRQLVEKIGLPETSPERAQASVDAGVSARRITELAAGSGSASADRDTTSGLK